MNVRELMSQRHDHFTAADKLVRAARESGKDLAGGELELFNQHIQTIKNIDALVDRAETAYPDRSFPRDRSMPGEKSEQSAFPIAGASGPDFRVTMGRTPVRREQSSVAMSIRQAFALATPEEREQLQAFTQALRGNIQAAANLVPSSDGGYLIPSLVQAAMERSYTAFNPVVQVARLFATDNGDPMTFPVLSDSDTAAQLAPAAATGADATVSGDAPPTALTGPKLGSYKVSSKPVFVNRELITDGVGGIDIITEILGALLARVIRFENLKYTKGNGTSEAEGFMTNCSTYAAGAVPIDLDICLDLVYACPALYRPQGVYMMSDTTCKYLRKIKTGISGDKQLLWADADYTKGTPLTLHGYPVYINNDMDSVNADGTFTGKSPLAFGDFKRFVVRQAEQNRPFIYRYSVPAKDGQAVILFRRSDSKLLVATAIYRLIN